MGSDVDLLLGRLRAQRGPPPLGLECMAVLELSPVRGGHPSGTARRTRGRLGRHHAWWEKQRRAQRRLRVGWTLPVHAEPAVRGRRHDLRRCEPDRELFVPVGRSRAAQLRIPPRSGRRGTLVGAAVRTAVPRVSTGRAAILPSVAQRADMIAEFLVEPWSYREQGVGLPSRGGRRMAGKSRVS